MKSAIVLLGASALASAQSLPDGFPQCGSVCVPNMMSQASNFNCDGSDWRCLCSSTDFVYGVRDCSDQACPKDSDDANVVKAWGKTQCASVGIDIEGIGGSATGSVPSATATVTATGVPANSESASGSAAASGSQSATAITTSDIVSTISSDGSVVTSTVGQTTIFGGGAVGVPVSTQAIVTTIVSDGSSITSTIGQTTIFSSGQGASSSGGANPSQTQSGSGSAVTSNVETTVTSDGSTFVTSTQAEQTPTSQGEAPASSTTSNPAAMKTVAPVGAFVAAAGFGLLML